MAFDKYQEIPEVGHGQLAISSTLMSLMGPMNEPR